MLEVTPLVNIQLNMFSRSLCYVDLSLLNRCSEKMRADPRVVVGSRSLCSELMSTPGNRKWQLDLTPTLGNIMRNDEFWVFTCSESLSAPFLAILKWNDDLRRWFSPKRHIFKRRLSTLRFNWLTFIFSQYNIYILYIFCGVIRIQILDWWSSSRKKTTEHLFTPVFFMLSWWFLQ